MVYNVLIMSKLKINICSNRHEEVAFDGGKCPVCSLLDVINNREDDMLSLVDSNIDDQSQDIRRLTKRVAKLEHRVNNRPRIFKWRRYRVNWDTFDNQTAE